MEQPENDLGKRVARIESDLAGVFTVLAAFKTTIDAQTAAIESDQKNIKTLSEALYAVGENFRQLGHAVGQLQQLTGLPIKRAEPGQPN